MLDRLDWLERAERGVSSCLLIPDIEPLWDRCPEDDSGVQALERERSDSLRLLGGRKRSRVSSRISEPMASMAEAYFSRRRRDSVTMKSAKIRTRSVSLDAASSRCAKALWRSIAARANPSAGGITCSCSVAD